MTACLFLPLNSLHKEKAEPLPAAVTDIMEEVAEVIKDSKNSMNTGLNDSSQAIDCSEVEIDCSDIEISGVAGVGGGASFLQQKEQRWRR